MKLKTISLFVQLPYFVIQGSHVILDESPPPLGSLVVEGLLEVHPQAKEISLQVSARAIPIIISLDLGTSKRVSTLIQAIQAYRCSQRQLRIK